jgi:glycosyltransferase involved in cell wall biosynthesis
MDDDPPSPDDAQPGISELSARVSRIEAEIASLRELLARAYEETPRQAAALLDARRSPEYDSAYAGEPLVTVRIGTRGGSDVLFDRALRSVSEQIYANWEAVIVCDGRADETAGRIAALGDRRIRCVQRPRNGPYPSHEPARWQVAGSHPFNDAVALARGAWIAPIDDDDEWSADHLEVLVGAALSTRAELVYGVARVIVAGEGETYFGAWPPASGDFGFQAAIYHSALKTFLYDANAHMVDEASDWNLARRMIEAGVKFEFVEQAVTTYYVEAGKAGIDWWRDRLQNRGAFGDPAPVVGQSGGGAASPLPTEA